MEIFKQIDVCTSCVLANLQLLKHLAGGIWPLGVIPLQSILRIAARMSLSKMKISGVA